MTALRVLAAIGVLLISDGCRQATNVAAKVEEASSARPRRPAGTSVARPLETIFQTPQARNEAIERLVKRFAPVLRKELETGFKGLAVVDGLPDSPAEFRAVFGRAPSRADMASVASAKKTLRESRNVSTSLAQALESRSTFVVFVAHNDDGVLRLGQSILDIGDIEEIAARCERMQKICMFLVCNGRAHTGEVTSYPRPLSPGDAARRVRDMDLSVRQNISSPEDMIRVAVSTFDADNSLRVWGSRAGILVTGIAAPRPARPTAGE